ncbi:hypothetical protein ABT052_43485 [Streptomyces sp. NPDC002766]|uniref:hypothetical protein n=1 Tax=unclassified Streptomyces TaxID=2593676 RepID=UPI00332B4865
MADRHLCLHRITLAGPGAPVHRVVLDVDAVLSGDGDQPIGELVRTADFDALGRSLQRPAPTVLRHREQAAHVVERPQHVELALERLQARPVARLGGIEELEEALAAVQLRVRPTVPTELPRAAVCGSSHDGHTLTLHLV